MTLLAESNEGLHNLFRMSSYASLEGYYFKAPARPRAAADLLERRHRHDRLRRR
jgi:DNA polymerase-3 subunit alpha